jgi:hypothetical protein
MTDVDPSFDFSNLEPIEIAISYKGQNYFLREASEDAHKQYRSRAMKCYSTDGQIKNPDLVAETPQWFVQQCLYTESGGDSSKRIAIDIIKSMPTRIVSKLFTKLRKISGMDEEELTAEELRRRIDELQKKLEEVERREVSGESPPTS